MEISMLVAKLLGAMYVTVGLGMLISSKYYEDLIGDFVDNKAVTYMGGLMALAAGILLTNYHNIWEQSWVVIITIIGWLALAKGVAILVVPGHTKMWKGFLNKNSIKLVAIFAIALGGCLAYQGYFVGM